MIDFSVLVRVIEQSEHGQKRPFLPPPQLPYFIGRDVEQTQLQEAFSQKAPLIVCQGANGVGKTALATYMANQLQTQFPDGVLWARVDSRHSLDILGSWAVACGKELSAMDTLPISQNNWQSWLKNKRTLVILDNAQSAEQVLPLLPVENQSCAIVVTTSQTLNLPLSWTTVLLQPFSLTTAQMLFRRLLGKTLVNENRDIFQRMAEQVERLPLALTLLAGQVRGGKLEETAVAIRHHHTQLSHLKREARAIRAAINLAYAHLPPTLQYMLAQLGAFGGDDFSLSAMQFVTNTTPDEALMGLHTLRGFALLETSVNGRYRLHPIIRDFALEQLAEDTPHTTRRLAQYFIRQFKQGSISSADSHTLQTTWHQLNQQGQQEEAQALLDATNK